MISPTIGRVVWFYAGGMQQRDAGVQPQAALVAYVWTDRMVNLGGFAHNGNPIQATSVTLLQDDDEPPHLSQPFAMWMPYQVGQAKKHALTEADAAADLAGTPRPS